jgi:pimeloyl-ACP methyl ester carboxylesterase
MARIAVAGHSLGGIVALLAVEQDPRLRAGITIDGVGPEAVVKPTRTPVLILAAGREEWRDNECRLWKDLRGPRLAVNLKSAEHVTPSDAVWLAKGAVNTGPMGSDKTIFAVRDYLAAFLDGNLRGKAFDPLLTGPSSEYPDITVTTQKQSLCGDTMKHSSDADDAKSR